MDANSVHTKGDDTPPRSLEKTEATTPAQETPKPLDVPTPKPEPQEASAQTEEPKSAETPEATKPSEPAVEPEQKPEPQTSSAGVIVLQWLTYAFWGWLILGLLWLMSVVLVNFILKESVNEVVPYAIAASVVLLPLAFVCDLFYRKHEPVKKAGGAMVIMVIHAVLFAVLGIIALIVAVFIGVNALINIGEPLDSQMVGLLTALFAALLYTGAFLRTLNAFKSRKPAVAYGISMIVVTVTLLALTITGPVVASVATRGDRVIEQSLPRVQSSVQEYISTNNKLPASLKDVAIEDKDAKQLVDDNKVEFIAEGKTSNVKLKSSTTNEESSASISSEVTFRYQLCVDYTAEAGSGSYRGTGYYNEYNDGYNEYISTYSHGAGRTCYKLMQTVYQEQVSN